MVAWIWIGGVVVVLGGTLALWPPGSRARAPVAAAAPVAISGASDPGPPSD
jgi:hypothetical protein